MFEPVFNTYCVNEIGYKYFNKNGIESFHMNTASMIKYLSNDRYFKNENSFKITRDGKIINTEYSKIKIYNPKSLRECSLINELHKIGYNNGKNSKTVSFDGTYNWKNVGAYIAVMENIIDKICPQLNQRLDYESQKNLVINFYTECERIAMNPVEHHERDTFVVDLKGDIYSIDGSYDKTMYTQCQWITHTLNNIPEMEEGFSVTNVEIAVQASFKKDGYDDVKKMKPPPKRTQTPIVKKLPKHIPASGPTEPVKKEKDQATTEEPAIDFEVESD